MSEYQFRVELSETISTDLQRELAGLASVAVRGYSDARPIDHRLVRSRTFRPSDDAPPVLATARCAGSGLLAGWAALRRPDVDESHARVWGPVIAPKFRGKGLADGLLRAVIADCDYPLRTTDVPHDRPEALRFFTARGWQPEPAKCTMLAESATRGGAPGVIALVTLPGRSLASRVSEIARVRARLEPGLADIVLSRWCRDHRFRPEQLLGHLDHPCLLLLLPQSAGTASELLFAELWSADEECARELVRAGLGRARELGCRQVRAVVPSGLTGPYQSHEFRRAGCSNQFRREAVRP